MKKLRYYYWIIQSFISKHGKVIIPAAILGALTFTQLDFIISYMPKPKPTHLIGRVGVYSLSNLPKDIQVLVSDGLTSIDESGIVIPNLAKEWQIIDEGKTYIFTLKENLTWKDGTTFTTRDINYSIADAQIEVLDDQRIAFKLQAPFSPFPSIVSQPLFKRTTSSYLQVFTRSHIVGTGEYEINKITYDNNTIDTIELESASERRIYHFYGTEQAAITAFKLAEIDSIEDITMADELLTWNNVRSESKTNLQRYVAVFFNTTDKNLNNKNIRQALTYAIPNKPNDNRRALGPISTKSWAFNPNVKPYEYSLEKAKELVSDSNMEFELELTTTPTYTKLAEEIKKSWEQLGLTVKVKVVNVPDTQQYQALLIGQQVPQDPDQYLLWHSTQNSNITKYNSAKIDKLLQDGRTESDIAKRKETYLDFQRFLVEDSPAAFLFYLDTVSLFRAT